VDASASPGWPLRRLPARAVAAVLAVEAAAVALVAVSVTTVPRLPDMLLAAAVAGFSVVHTELRSK
jgi:hypothetical protein